MSLLSNSLFLDSEYRADCEYKINYLNVINNKNTNEIKPKDFGDKDENIDSKEELREIFDALETRIIKNRDSKPTFTDGQILYNTKQISDKDYKILLEIDNSTLPESENNN